MAGIKDLYRVRVVQRPWAQGALREVLVKGWKSTTLWGRSIRKVQQKHTLQVTIVYYCNSYIIPNRKKKKQYILTFKSFCSYEFGEFESPSLSRSFPPHRGANWSAHFFALQVWIRFLNDTDFCNVVATWISSSSSSSSSSMKFPISVDWNPRSFFAWRLHVSGCQMSICYSHPRVLMF